MVANPLAKRKISFRSLLKVERASLNRWRKFGNWRERAMEDARFSVNNFEASLEELLAEPIVRQLMRRDGVSEASVRQLVRQSEAARAKPKLRFNAPMPDIGKKSPPLPRFGVVTQAAAPAWPRVFPGL
jgi:hypothetical protein